MSLILFLFFNVWACVDLIIISLWLCKFKELFTHKNIENFEPKHKFHAQTKHIKFTHKNTENFEPKHKFHAQTKHKNML